MEGLYFAVLCLMLTSVIQCKEEEAVPSEKLTDFGNTSDCLATVGHGNYNLKVLGQWSPWIVRTNKKGFVLEYRISLCQPLKGDFKDDPCEGNSVCLINGTTRMALSSFEPTLEGNQIDAQRFFIRLHGPPCKIPQFNIMTNSSVTLDMVCSKHLDGPSISVDSPCMHTFSWPTSAACVEDQQQQKEIPCSVYDSSGRYYDLLPLLKSRGAHSVIGRAETEFYINICSNIVPDGKTAGCPPGVSACWKTANGNFVGGGQLNKPLVWKKSHLELTYEMETKVDGCTESPKTVIRFVCPAQGTPRRPHLVFNDNCLFSVLWETEFACPTSVLLGNLTTCSFRSEQHGVSIDLSGLRKSVDSPYNVTTTNGSGSFILNVCGRIGKACDGGKWSSSSSAACFIDNQGGAKLIGSLKSAELKYVEKKLSLTYESGTGCDKSSTARVRTIINFVCSRIKTTSVPNFIGQEDCSYIFEWPTEAACVEERQIECRIQSGPLSIELDPFNQEWTAVDGVSNKGHSREIHMNFCSSLGQVEMQSKCPDNAAICMIENGTTLSLGQSNTNIMGYDASNGSHIFEAKFSNGSPCPNGKENRSSILTMVCAFDSYTSSPVLISQPSNCHYNFEWRTPRACPKELLQFKDCKFLDSKERVLVDLSALHSSTSYKIETAKHDYYINLCGPVTGTKCNSNGMMEARGCQVEKNSNISRAWNLGQNLSSFSFSADGEMINMAFNGGTPYNNAEKTPRSMSIALVCDLSIQGIGHPELVGEENRAYGFLWRTSVVCPNSEYSQQCSAFDPVKNLQYDLSSLNRENGEDDWWIMNPKDQKQKIYLNVCGSLNKSGKCPKDSAICLATLNEDQKESSYISLGRALEKPFVGKSGLTLRYTQGQNCSIYGQSSSYSATINFICNRDASKQNQGPKLLSYAGCHYLFLWATEAACPIGKVDFKECRFTDPNSGRNYDLSVLSSAKGFYNISTPGGRFFQLNICAPVTKPGCAGAKTLHNPAACELYTNGTAKQVLGYSDVDSISITEAGQARITYKGPQQKEDPKTELELLLECSPGETEPKIRFLREDGEGHFYFVVQTEAICVKRPQQCTSLTDPDNNEYNLNSLSGNSMNQVYRAYKNASSIEYFFSFCSGFQDDVEKPCRNTGGCMIDKRNPQLMASLGSQMNSPVAPRFGTVIFTFSEGSQCPHGLKYSAVITMTCSRKQGVLILIDETDECQLIFTMETPAACPIQVSKGRNCRVTEPVYGYVFNLNSLRKTTDNYVLTDQMGNQLEMNICGAINKAPLGCEGAAVCHKQGNLNLNYGKASQDLVYQNGILTLTYEGGSPSRCSDKNSNQSTILTFVCSGDTQFSARKIEDTTPCVSNILIMTSLACPPRQLIPCIARDEAGHYYDLEGLSLTNRNYFVTNPNNPKFSYSINICRTVFPMPGHNCPYDASSCLVEQNPLDIKSVGLGRITGPPEFIDGALIMRYSFGEPCKDGQSETVIEFRCDADDNDSKPEFVSATACTHNFLWYTKYACPIENGDSEIMKGNCTIFDSKTNHLYDLTSLMSSEGVKISTPSHSHSFTLSVCAPITNSPCTALSGSCQTELSGEKRNFSGGLANANLHLNEGSLFLKYSFGTPCHSGKFLRDTVIQFICDPKKSELIFISESYNCSYLFNWYTSAACGPASQITKPMKEDDNALSCAVQTKNGMIDLSDLNPLNGLFTLFHNDLPGIYALAICKKLKWLISFPDEAAAGCYHCFGKNLSQSLGQYTGSPYVDSDDLIILEYTNGSACPSDESKRISSKIIIECNYKKLEDLTVLGFVDDQCTFIFLLETSKACPTKLESCAVGQKDKGFHFDLSNLQNQVFNVTAVNGSMFQLSLCKPLSGSCAGSSVCLLSGKKSQTYGSVDNSHLYHNGVHMTYSVTSNKTCPYDSSKKMSAEILFHCNLSAGIGQPALYKQEDCHAVFLWSSAEACTEVNQPLCTLWTNKTLFYDLRFLSSISHNWNLTDDQGVKYLINLCRELRPSADTFIGCPSTAAVCLIDKTTGHSLGNVRTQKLYLDENTNNLMLTYEDGSDALCDSVKASTEIRFVCGSKLGAPKFVQQTNCRFKFVWQTHLACPNMENQPLSEKEGIVCNPDLTGSYFLNFTDLYSRSFQALEENRSENYTYMIDLGSGVANGSAIVSSPRCKNAAICQTKADGSFFRDIGSLGTGKFYHRGSELLLILTSTGRKCGKNKFKNVTSTIKFQCSSAADLGVPRFLYESGDCDYIFDWETSAACFSTPIGEQPCSFSDVGITRFEQKSFKKEDVSTEGGLSTSSIVGIIFGLIFITLLVALLSKKQRRSAIRAKVKSCFQRVPNYRNVQCYFLRLGSSDSHLLRPDGHTVLLEDDDAPKFQDDSDVDPIA